MQNSHPFTSPFVPVSCAEVLFSTESGEEPSAYSVTWLGIVASPAPRLWALLAIPPDRKFPPKDYSFSVRLPAAQLWAETTLDSWLRDNVHSQRPASTTAAALLQCHSGTARLEHGRLLLCGEIAAVHLEDNSSPWLNPLLRQFPDTRPPLAAPPIH